MTAASCCHLRSLFAEVVDDDEGTKQRRRKSKGKVKAVRVREEKLGGCLLAAGTKVFLSPFSIVSRKSNGNSVIVSGCRHRGEMFSVRNGLSEATTSFSSWWFAVRNGEKSSYVELLLPSPNGANLWAVFWGKQKRIIIGCWLMSVLSSADEESWKGHEKVL